MAGISVEELRRLVLPPGSEIAAGRGGAGRDVTWPVTMRTRPPAFPALRGGEFALISTEAMRLLDPKLTLASVVKSLSGHRASGVAILGDISPEARDVAEELGLTVISLPPFAHLADLEQLVSRAIVDRRTELHQRSQEIYRQLTELAIEGRGIPAILDRLAHITGRSVVLEDQEFRASRVLTSNAIESEDLVSLLQDNSDRVASWVERATLSSSDPPTATFELADGIARVVAPIVVRDHILGYLSLVGRSESLGEMEELAASRGASACAIELVREKAVLEVEDRMQSDLLDALVTGTYPSIEIVRARAERLGFDLSANFTVIVFQARVDPGPSDAPGIGRVVSRTRRLQHALERDLTLRGLHALIGVRGNEAVLLYPVESPADISGVKTLAEDERRNLANHLDATVSAGVGGVYPGAGGIKVAYQEADGALSMGSFIFGSGRTTYFGELGLYRLLLVLRGTTELENFFQQTLAKLVEYDRKNDGEMVRTLEAYFACLGSPTDAAERLHVHRNTLLYRLNRVQEIGGFDLDDSETRLALHLALRVREVLQASQRSDS
ncbi:MAG TPA: helix-turn-helix domain-containing protein [Chloroflexota bacterium]|nr:helix-turn-helix domain-containing protein [Chloroflexota bacterium]